MDAEPPCISTPHLQDSTHVLQSVHKSYSARMTKEETPPCSNMHNGTCAQKQLGWSSMPSKSRMHARACVRERAHI